MLLGRDGKSRQFAFIGYRTNEEAEEALKYFNNTYIDTCKITCEVLSFLIVFDKFSPCGRATSLVNCLYEIELDSDEFGFGISVTYIFMVFGRLPERLVTLMLLAPGAAIL